MMGSMMVDPQPSACGSYHDEDGAGIVCWEEGGGGGGTSTQPISSSSGPPISYNCLAMGGYALIHGYHGNIEASVVIASTKELLVLQSCLCWRCLCSTSTTWG